MKLNLFQQHENEEEHIDIYYHQSTPIIEKVKELVQNNYPILYGVKQEEKIILDIDEIYYFDSVDKKTFAYLKQEVYQITFSLAELEFNLRGYGFIRINKSNVVNIYKIKKIKNEPNMRIVAILDNDEQIIINRSYKKKFEEFLNEMREVSR